MKMGLMDAWKCTQITILAHSLWQLAYICINSLLVKIMKFGYMTSQKIRFMAINKRHYIDILVTLHIIDMFLKIQLSQNVMQMNLLH